MSNSKSTKMYNLNVNVATALPVSFLSLDGQSNTPRTPEIVNSLMAMTNPFDTLVKPLKESNSPGSEESCSGTASPIGSPNGSPPSVQHTRSQLIKEGLKLTIQTKRKHSGSEAKEDFEEFETKRMKREELTEEDEERRKRRRERNKIAATKCRMKKREKTANLVNESEVLETQNIELKSQIQDLQKQRKKLMDMLSMHTATCLKRSSVNIHSQTFEDLADGFGSHQNFVSGDSAGAVTAAIGSDERAMNPYGKDPNFAKMLDEVTITPTDSYTRAPGQDRLFSLSVSGSVNTSYDNSSGSTNYYDSKGKYSEKENIKRSRYGYLSEKEKLREKKSANKVIELEENSGDRGFHCDDNEDSDAYKPNGIIDSSFFANRADVFAVGNDYSTNFGNNVLDNGCMA